MPGTSFRKSDAFARGTSRSAPTVTWKSDAPCGGVVTAPRTVTSIGAAAEADGGGVATAPWIPGERTSSVAGSSGGAKWKGTLIFDATGLVPRFAGTKVHSRIALTAASSNAFPPDSATSTFVTCPPPSIVTTRTTSACLLAASSAAGYTAS